MNVIRIYDCKKIFLRRYLANEVGVSRQTISKWETYQSIPEVDKVQILGIFGVS